MCWKSPGQEDLSSARESSLKVHHELFLFILDVKRGKAAKKDLKAIGANEEQTKRVWNSIPSGNEAP